MSEKLDLDALQRLHEATSKDWSIPNARVGSVVVGGPMQTFTNGTAQQQIAMFCGNDATDEQQRDANAAFAVALHAAFPALIARIRDLESRASNAGGAVGTVDYSCSGSVRWREGLTQGNFPDGTPLYTHPAPAQTSAFDANAERWRLDSEELEAFHMSMDKFDVPRATKFGVVMSAFGRAVKYAAMLAAAPAKPEGPGQ
jgi:hypothetical protein